MPCLLRCLARFVWSLVLLLGLLVGAGAVWAAEPIGFALLSSRSQPDAEAAWTPLLDALGRRLGVPVEAHWYPEYAEAIWGLRQGRDRLAMLGNKSAIEAVDNAGVEVFAAQLFGGGAAGYHAMLLVGAESRWTDVEQLIGAAGGLTLGLGDPNSTSGTVVPTHYLFHARGVEPREVFRRVVHGSHPGNIRGVAEGRLDAATVSSVTYDHFRDDHPDVAARTRIVWRSPPIPGSPLVWTRTLPEAQRAEIRRFFVEYGRPAPEKGPTMVAAEQKVLAGLDVAGFGAAGNDHLVPVRRLDLALDRYLTERLPPGSEDRARRLAEIDRRLGELDRQPPDLGAR